MATTKTMNNPSVHTHMTREENLLAAKRAVRRTRHAWIMRHTGTGADILDIMVGTEIIERHVCNTEMPFTPLHRKRVFCVEALALYQ